MNVSTMVIKSDDPFSWLKRPIQPEGTDELHHFFRYKSLGSFVGCTLKSKAVETWLRQFDEDDIDTANNLLWDLHFIDLRTFLAMCRLAYVQLSSICKLDPTKARYIPVGEAAKSGHLVSYFFRTANHLSEDLFISAGQKTCFRKTDTIVFLDDYAGTGNQFIKWWQRTQFANLTKVEQVYWCPTAFISALERIEKATRARPICLMPRRDDSEWSMSTSTVDKLLKKYGTGLYKVHKRDFPLGYRGSRSAVVFFYNTPNNVPPIFWASGTNSRGQNWRGLFPRREKAQPANVAALKATLADIIGRQEASVDDFIVVSDLAKDVARTRSLRIRDYILVARLISEYLFLLSNYRGFVLWPPLFSESLYQLRSDIVRIATERAVTTNPIQIQHFENLFSLDEMAVAQGGLVSPTLTEVLLATLPSIKKGYSALRSILVFLDHKNFYVANTTLWVFQGLAEDRNLKDWLRKLLESFAPTSVQGQYFRHLLRSQIDEQEKRKLEVFLTSRRKKQINVRYNYYGKYLVSTLAWLEENRTRIGL